MRIPHLKIDDFFAMEVLTLFKLFALELLSRISSLTILYCFYSIMKFWLMIWGIILKKQYNQEQRKIGIFDYKEIVNLVI